MKYNHFPTFEKALSSKSLSETPFLFTIIYKEDFLRQKAVDVIIKKFNTSAATTPAITFFDGEEAPLASLMDEISTLSFFASLKILILNNAEKISKAESEKLEQIMASPSSSSILILSYTALAANTRLYKIAEKHGALLEIPEEKSWEKEKNALEWLLHEAAAQNIKIESKAAQLLVKQIGPDYALLAQELEKLVCYTYSKQLISLKDVEDISVRVHSETAWQLGEALFLRDSPSALRIAQGLLKDGVAFLTLLRQIRSQFQIEFQVCSLLARGATPEQVTQNFPYMKGRILEHHLQMAKNYGMERFRRGIICIDEHELMAKNSSTEHTLLAQRLIIKLTLS